MHKKTDLKKGLSAIQVERRVINGQVNGQHNLTTKTIRQIVKANIFTLFNAMNLFLAICVAFVHSYKNMLFMGVVISNVAVGIFQEIRAKRIIDRLTLISVPKTLVLREGNKKEIDPKDIVLGDILLLNSGNQVCVDAVIAQGQCDVDESMITGESEPVLKQVGDELLSGSYIVSGDVKAQAIKVGKESYVNQIVSGAKYIKKPNSEMMRSINWIIKIVSTCIIPLGAILLFKQIYMGNQDFDRAVVSTVAAMIGMIPEGLVLLSSAVLAVSTIRLAREHTLVQELYCVETLARVDVLCLDKTGTITEGNMIVDDVVFLDGSEKDVADGLNAMMGCLNDGNATFLAIKERYHESMDWVVQERIPFNSANKWSLVEFKEHGTYILGAPEYVLKDKAEPLMDTLQAYAKEGQRVLLLAHANHSVKNKMLPESMRPMAFLILSDKIRSEAKETLDYFKDQGVDIKIISGDNPLTVANVAKKAGIEDIRAIDMTQVTDTEEIERVVEDYNVFGRVTPYQKLSIVKSLKKKDHTVAMTGDGVNDVLVLKEADCSIAMQSGSDAARNVSQLVLLDSNFAHLPHVVAEGRRSINNLQRSASLFLVKTIYAFLLALIFIFINKPYPYQPIQLTLISSTTIGIPSFLLALEPNYNRVKDNFLFHVLQKALPGGILTVTNVVLIAFLSDRLHGSVDQIATITTLSTEFAQLLVLYRVCKPFNGRRRILFIGIIALFIAEALIFHEIFIIVPLTMGMVAFVACLMVVSILLHPIYIRLVEWLIQRRK
ncbi:cation-transporting ATPase, E1-E2 family [Lachnospiraceae bacterium KM106-2]|nr:cation-transporting ATPase, E1-E2 family [Lachnospiraceae bacterium KM106-2]